MDYSLTSPQERVNKVNEIIASTPKESLTPYYLTKLADYILEAVAKQNKKEIITKNRLVTVNAREMSLENLQNKFENNEDYIYNLVRNDKNIIFRHKDPITDQDREEIPLLKDLYAEIASMEERLKHTRGKAAFTLKKQIIEMRQRQYEIKSAYKKPHRCNNLIKSISQMNLDETIAISEGQPQSSGYVSLFKPEHISILLCNYSAFKEDTWADFSSDLKWLILDLENIIDKTLKTQYPLLYDLLIYKIDGITNAEIQEKLLDKYNLKYTQEYLSTLWRQKIPKLLAETATNDYLIWHYTYKEKGQWKKCSKCHEIKLAHPNFFSRNKPSKDGFYSICKCCRKNKFKKGVYVDVGGDEI